MSRSGYTETDNWQIIKWRGQVAAATRGRRGQQFFRDLIAALDAMEVKELASGKLQAPEGPVCAMGMVARYRQVDLTEQQAQIDDDEDPDWHAMSVGEKLDIARQLAMETAYVNDEAGHYNETPTERWARVRRWAEKQIRE